MRAQIIDGKPFEFDAGFFIYAARNKSGIPGGLGTLKFGTTKYRLARKMHAILGLETLYRSILT